MSSSVTSSSPRITRTASGNSLSSRNSSFTRLGPMMSTSREGWHSNTFMLNIGIPEERRGLFRQHRVDIETRAPFKARDLREFWHDLDVPMIEIAGTFVQR